MQIAKLKRISALICTGLIVTLSTTARAESDNEFLKLISDNTAATLERVNNLPNFLASMGEFVTAWMTPDTSDTTATIQASFAQMGNLLIQNNNTQMTLQSQLNADLLKDANKNNMPYANDLVYSTMLGSPFFSPDPRGSSVVPQYNYVKNASGMTLKHVVPAPSWRGKQDAILRYQNYYNTVTAVESFNGYVLSSQYAEGNQFNQLQQTLIQQASDPQSWFAEVASENIGWVLRQLLMYQSQSFVLLTQMVQLQKQMVTAQAMTNAVSIAGNYQGETLMVNAATGS